MKNAAAWRVCRFWLVSGAKKKTCQSGFEMRFILPRMKLLSQLASLSAAATLMLQLGTFVEASPFFTENAATAHSNAADPTQQCEGLSFEENSKHVVAWQAPKSLDQIALTLVSNSDSSNPISVGTYKFDKGATEELPLELKGQQPGQYHYHIQSGDCSIDSVEFTITAEQQKTTPPVTSAQDAGDHTNDDETFDNLIQTMKGLPSDNTDSNSNDAHLDQLVNDLKHTESTHSNDEAFDELVSNISKSHTVSNSDQSLDDLVNNLKSTETNHLNDEALDGLVNDLKSTETKHLNDDALDGLVNDLKSTEKQHATDDEALDNLVSQLPSKSTTSHQDIALNSDLDSLSGNTASNDDDDLDALVNDIAKSTQADNDHKNEKSTSSADWDSMIEDLKSHSNQQEEPKKESSTSQGLDQVIDDLAKSIKDKSHSDADTEPSTKEYESFKSFIDDLDQDYTKYLANNKESESKQVSHKNDAKLDGEAPADSHANEWFTNTDLRTKTNSKRAFNKRGENNYFTNEDRRTTHANAVPVTDPVPPTDSTRPVWAVNGGYFTNDDQRTNVNSGVHNDAEWAEDAAPATRPVWAVNGGFFTNDDQRTNVNSAHNDAEWAEDAADVGEDQEAATRPVWAVNGGFFTNDDQRTNVNSAHNDAEWAEDAATPAEEQQDGVWHMDEIADVPEWNVNEAALDNHENSVWESTEDTDEPAYVEAPVHHPNDIEWTVGQDAPSAAPIHHPNDVEWSVNAAEESPLMDHTNFVHWDSESIDAQVEQDDDSGAHVDAAEGEWFDADQHIDDASDLLEWAEDSVDDFEDDDTHTDGAQWETTEHANDMDLDNTANRWSLNDGATEWSTNAFDENDVTASSANDHTDAAAPGVEETPQWLSSEHANDDHEDEDASSWSVNDGPSEWAVDEDVVINEAHENDATFISEWLTSEHANDDHEDEAPAGWSVNETPAKWNVSEAPAEWNVNEAPAEWNVNSGAESQHANAVPEWTTSEHANDDMEQTNSWSLNEDPTEWSTNSIDVDAVEEGAYEDQQHNNAADATTGSEWVSSEHANDDHEDEDASSWSVNDGPAEWQVNDNDIHADSAAWTVSESDHENAVPEWSTSEHANDDHEDEHLNANEWNVNDASVESVHSNAASPQWLTANSDHSDSGDWAVNDVTW
ncbi:hypothetical protein [Absidia glauca]|uniref:Uncharacterized protein n=1 Tax=Absidia glauca TaxID=4829 RepID=A0A168Q8I5_ABSGL|nr:hypothetical protein [Absidia glauca]